MPTGSDQHRSKRRRTSHSRSRSPLDSRKHYARPRATKLPFNALELSKHDFDHYRPMFANYLDIQKRLDIRDISHEEARGRWKSFVKKWNNGELAEGWYDPAIKRKAFSNESRLLPSTSATQKLEAAPKGAENADRSEDEDDEYGPQLPANERIKSKSGPSIPNFQDLEMRKEEAAEAVDARHEDLRWERKMDRKQQKERLEELVPRAEPGTRERQLEKKAEKASQAKSYRDKSPGAPEVAEGDLMGDDGIEGYKAKKAAQERKKSEKELRREEIWRARAEEREERMAERRAKDEKTMDMLRALAKERFG
ncbi:MAG: hypothetical protein M1820_003137 [Bogoriella megaspora]|nr:MAG: hypothetical protein M1820_003137 [Bogoriella megaspora]